MQPAFKSYSHLSFITQVLPAICTLEQNKEEPQSLSLTCSTRYPVITGEYKRVYKLFTSITDSQSKTTPTSSSSSEDLFTPLAGAPTMYHHVDYEAKKRCGTFHPVEHVGFSEERPSSYGRRFSPVKMLQALVRTARVKPGEAVLLDQEPQVEEKVREGIPSEENAYNVDEAAGEFLRKKHEFFNRERLLSMKAKV